MGDACQHDHAVNGPGPAAVNAAVARATARCQADGERMTAPRRRGLAQLQAHAAAFLICDCCGATEEVTPGAADGLARAAAAAGYRIERTTIEAHGRCPGCSAAA